MNTAISFQALQAAIIYQLPAQTMVQSVDSLINQLVPIRSLEKLASPLLKQQAVEAIVISSTKVAAAKQSNTQALFQINLSTAGNSQNNGRNDNAQQYQITSKVPIDVGTKLLLKINADNSALLLKVLSQPNASNTSSAANSQTAPSNPAQLVLENNLRQTVPLQQPLKLLLPLLIQSQSSPLVLGNTPQSNLLSQNIAQLLNSFPTPGNLQNPAGLKQAINNSGIFLESKLANASTQTSPASQAPTANPGTTASQNIQQSVTNSAVGNSLAGNSQAGDKAAGSTANTPTAAPPNPANNDLKAQIQSLSQQVDKAVSQTQQQTASQTASTVSNSTSQTAATGTEKPAELIDKAALIPAANLILQAAAKPKSTNNTSSKDNLDIVLRQLGKQLLASIARTQVNQLESMANRAQLNPENPTVNNSFVLELPILNGKRIDNLEMKIQEEDVEDKDGELQKCWSVMLSFDLHSMGKMSVQLRVIDQSVAATIWSELKPTHSLVREHINDLEKNLEGIGVTVNKMETFLGTPPKQLASIHRQLVDVRT